MKETLPKRWFAVAFLSSLCVVAITYVQHNRVPGRIENLIRNISSICGLTAVPLLVSVACARWSRLSRHELPGWRNGLGLSSIVLLSCIWIYILSLRLLGFVRPTFNGFFSLEWFATVLYTTLAAALLAVALRGVSRIIMVAAALLTWAYLQSGIYF